MNDASTGRLLLHDLIEDTITDYDALRERSG
jgi:hypothetical protein